MSREDYNMIGYVVALVSEFANRYGILPRQAYSYLKRFNGLDHFYKHYNVMHTFSFEENVDALSQICKDNGGKL